MAKFPFDIHAVEGEACFALYSVDIKGKFGH